MTGELAAAYQSGSQRARIVTESWGESNLYCPNADKSRAGLRFQTETRVFPVAARNTLVAVAPDGT
ncbi:MAG: DpnI domain-containing protein [Verrucomicrobiota bacterium]|jgi:hypothetical protein